MENIIKLSNVEGITQKSMCMLSGVFPSTIYRLISDKKIMPIDGKQKKNSRYSISDTRKILKKYISDKFIPNKKMHSFFNFKGGVGKTSICFQVGTHLTLCGYNVLLVDLDAQAHLSTALRIPISESYFTFYDACIGNVKLEDTIQNIYEGLDCIPSNFSLSRTDLEVTKDSAAGKILENIFVISEISSLAQFIGNTVEPYFSQRFAAKFLVSEFSGCSEFSKIINGLLIAFNSETTRSSAEM